jgi:predicted dehydrogenase
VYHIRNYNQNFSRRDDWQTLAKNGGGALFNKCSHNLDIIMQLMGAKVVDVMGDLQQIASGGDVEDHVKALLRAENGCTADMEVTSAQNIAVKLPEWILCGEYGTLTCDGRQSVIRWFDPKAAGSVEVIDGAALNRSYASQAPPLPWQEKTVEAKGPSIGNYHDNVAGVLLRNEPMKVTPESVREVMRVMAEIRKGTKFNVAPFV